MPPCHRRRLLQSALGLALFPFSSVNAEAPRPTASVRFHDYPFKLGVASGDPLADGFVIWTRLAPEPLAPYGGILGDQPIPVRWEVAEDEGFERVVTSGTLLARADQGYSVRANVMGLSPDQVYYYRFMAGAEVSPVGRSRTFPVVGSAVERLRLGWASCAHFGQGYFSAYRHLLNEELDLMVHVGDYLYESSYGPRVRFHLPEPTTLEEYRAHHALYKSDPDLQALHARYPWVVTWDDHEVDNDYAGLYSEESAALEEAFVQRRANAYRAYFEHMPLRLSARPQNGELQLYQSLHYGDLAHLMLLDNRQYRDDQACGGPERFGGQIVVDCDERLDPKRSLLGAQQERWLAQQLSRSTAHWRLIVQQTLLASLRQGHDDDGRDRRWSDGWDGYAATRQRLFELIQRRAIDNVITLGGDLHSFWVTDLKADFDDPNAKTLATEFVTGSVTAITSDWAEAILPANPHVRYHHWQHRGYATLQLTKAEAQVNFRALENAFDPRSEVFTLASFAVEAGKAGATQG